MPKVGLGCDKDLVESRCVGRQCLQRCLEVFAHVGESAGHHLFDQVITGGEVVVDGRGLNVCPLGDVGQPGPGVALSAQHVCRGVQDSTARAGILRIVLGCSAIDGIGRGIGVDSDVGDAGFMASCIRR